MNTGAPFLGEDEILGVSVGHHAYNSHHSVSMHTETRIDYPILQIVDGATRLEYMLRTIEIHDKAKPIPSVVLGYEEGKEDAQVIAKYCKLLMNTNQILHTRPILRLCM